MPPYLQSGKEASILLKIHEKNSEDQVIKISANEAMELCVENSGKKNSNLSTI